MHPQKNIQCLCRIAKLIEHSQSFVSATAQPMESWLKPGASAMEGYAQNEPSQL